MRKTRERPFVVTNIDSYNTITVAPRWEWKQGPHTVRGDKVVINGISIDDEGAQAVASVVLEALLLKTDLVDDIQLLNATNVVLGGIVHCSVYLNGVDVSTYLRVLNTQAPKKENWLKRLYKYSCQTGMTWK